MIPRFLDVFRKRELGLFSPRLFYSPSPSAIKIRCLIFKCVQPFFPSPFNREAFLLFMIFFLCLEKSCFCFLFLFSNGYFPFLNCPAYPPKTLSFFFNNPAPPGLCPIPYSLCPLGGNFTISSCLGIPQFLGQGFHTCYSNPPLLPSFLSAKTWIFPPPYPSAQRLYYYIKVIPGVIYLPQTWYAFNLVPAFPLVWLLCCPPSPPYPFDFFLAF